MDLQTDDWAPVDACTLPTGEQPLRVAEFDDLFATSLRAVDRLPESAVRARLLFGGDEGLAARVQRLADAETACCSFFTFRVQPQPAHDAEAMVALEIEVPAARSDVLAALVERAERARSSAR
jgi:hypothetical protein